MQELNEFAGVDMYQTSDEDFCRQVSLVLNLDAIVPVDGIASMRKRAPRKYLADIGLKEVVKLNDRQYTLRNGKVLVKKIAGGVEPLEFRRKVENKM